MLQIHKGRKAGAIRTLLYGFPGVGKSTFAAGFPSPLFICAEHGADQINVDKVYPADWDNALTQIDAAAKLDAYETVVVDSLDALETMLNSDIITKAKEPDINSGELGYGRGYNQLTMRWRPLLAALDRVRIAGKHVVMIAHGAPKRIADPTLGEYDQFQPKLYEKVWGLSNEWADDVLFAAYDMGVKKSERKGGRDTAVITGERVLYATRGTGYTAKNRHNLPPTMPLDPVVYWDHIMASQRGASQVLDSITALLDSPKAADLKERVIAAVAKAGSDSATLQRIETHLREQLK